MIANWPSNNSKVIAQIRGSPVTQLCNNGFVLRKRINYVDGFDVGIPVLSPQLGLDNEGTFETWLWGFDGIDAGSAWIIAQPIDGEAFGS
jgi:hypothetical protein